MGIKLKEIVQEPVPRWIWPFIRRKEMCLGYYPMVYGSRPIIKGEWEEFSIKFTQNDEFDAGIDVCFCSGRQLWSDRNSEEFWVHENTAVPNDLWSYSEATSLSGAIRIISPIVLVRVRIIEANDPTLRKLVDITAFGRPRPGMLTRKSVRYA